MTNKKFGCNDKDHCFKNKASGFGSWPEVIAADSDLPISTSRRIDVLLWNPAAIDEDGFAAGVVDDERSDDVEADRFGVAEQASAGVLAVGNNEGP